MAKKVKDHSSGKLKQEFPELNCKYFRQHFWAISYGCWSTGNITEKKANQYLEHYRRPYSEQSNNTLSCKTIHSGNVKSQSRKYGHWVHK